MKRDNLVYVHQILDYIGHIEKFTENVSAKIFHSNIEKQLAVIRCFEVIGEAAKRLDLSFKEKYSQLDWRKISGFRDVPIHDYEGISLDIVWDTATIHLQKTKLQLLQILEDET